MDSAFGDYNSHEAFYIDYPALSALKDPHDEYPQYGGACLLVEIFSLLACLTLGKQKARRRDRWLDRPVRKERPRV